VPTAQGTQVNHEHLSNTKTEDEAMGADMIERKAGQIYRDGSGENYEWRLRAPKHDGAWTTEMRNLPDGAWRNGFVIDFKKPANSGMRLMTTPAWIAPKAGEVWHFQHPADKHQTGFIEIVRVDNGSYVAWRHVDDRTHSNGAPMDSFRRHATRALPGTNLGALSTGRVGFIKGVPVPAQHPSDAKRTATCSVKGMGGLCGDSGSFIGIGASRLCGLHYLESEEVQRVELDVKDQIARAKTKPMRIEPYEGLHTHLQVATLPKGVNPDGWEARKRGR
jgi:hypothetical protein